MRITTELLLKNAVDAVAERCQGNKDIAAAYLCGSVLGEKPLLGGTTDIDLVFIHQGEIVEERQIVRLTADVHLDIQHHTKSRYEQARELRQEPWLGWTLFDARPMYDPDHFLDFVQANLRGMFNSPENILKRAQSLLGNAREIWLQHHNNPSQLAVHQVRDFIRALQNAVNAVACLSGPPLAERRLLLDYLKRVEEVRQPGLYAGVLGLLGLAETGKEDIESWLNHWKQAFNKVNELDNTPVGLHQDRTAYYQRAIEAILISEHPKAAAWPLLSTWTKMAVVLPEESTEALAWKRILDALEFTGQGFEQRMQGLDTYLDRIEELIEYWQKEWQK